MIIKSYLAILLSVGSTAVFVFVLGLYFIFRKQERKSQPVVAFSTDLTAIAGDDIMTTQLDLARAFIETNKTHSAKQILETVIAKGSIAQQKEAQQLLGHL